MSSTRCICVRKMVPVLSCVILLGFAAWGRADPKPLSKEEQAKVDRAIDKAVKFLKGAQTKDGDWQWKMYRQGQYLIGQCALPAYALLEAGVPAEDAVIQKAAEFIRLRVLMCDTTYELSLAILFFDRLGDPQDERLIRMLALRLIAGQHYTGGWSYGCPLLNEENEQELLKSLEALSKRIKGGSRTRDKALEKIEVPLVLQPLTIFQRAGALSWQEPPAGKGVPGERMYPAGRTDNSNSQFAMLGLWAARRHAIPVQATFEIMVARFERFQLYPSGLWMYELDRQPSAKSPRSMICVGLIGLAIGRGLRVPTPGVSAGSEKDVHVLRGLAALHRAIGKPLGHMDKPVPLQNLYFLWSLERVGMLYDLPDIGGKEWYRWGAEALVMNQSRTGAWLTSPGPLDFKATINTAFALLFLKRSHPMKDLTPKLPFKAKELNEGIALLRPDDKFPVRPMLTSVESKSQNRTTSPSGAKNR